MVRFFLIENGFGKSSMISALIFDEPLELIFGDDSKGVENFPLRIYIWMQNLTYQSINFLSGRVAISIQFYMEKLSLMSFESIPELSKFSFNSNMKGISFNLPSSFGKVKEHEVPLEINWLFKKDHETINVNLFERFNADFRLENSKFSSGLVVIDDFPNFSSVKNSN